MERKTTDELLQEIQNEKSFERFMSRNEGNFEKVIKAAQIDRTYGHQLFNGTRRPSRDKVIQLAIAFELSVDDTQELLRVAGRNELYPRIRRDAAIIFGLSKHMEMQQMQEFLASLDISILSE